jgi:hypothetical protein
MTLRKSKGPAAREDKNCSFGQQSQKGNGCSPQLFTVVIGLLNDPEKK